jgi:hypothetical protein
VVNLVMYGKGVWCSEKFCGSGKFFGPLKWYTDRNFLGDGGGGRSPKLICSTNNFFGTGRAQSEKVGQISSRPLIFSFPYAHAQTCNFVVNLFPFF